MIKMFYYGMTTLSTIGIGDFLPKSVSEKILISFVMLFGVTVFSFIMNNLIDILNEFMSKNNNIELATDIVLIISEPILTTIKRSQQKKK